MFRPLGINIRFAFLGRLQRNQIRGALKLKIIDLPVGHINNLSPWKHYLQAPKTNGQRNSKCSNKTFKINWKFTKNLEIYSYLKLKNSEFFLLMVDELNNSQNLIPLTMSNFLRLFFGRQQKIIISRSLCDMPSIHCVNQRILQLLTLPNNRII